MAEAWEQILPAVTKVLSPRTGAGEGPKYTLDRALRVVRTAGAIVASLPDASRPQRVDLLKIAALFAGVEDGAEAAADVLKGAIPPGDVDVVLRVLKELRQRNTTMGEARVLSDAVSLEDIGMVGLWNQTRTFHAAGKSLEQLLKLWKTQQAYGYWETRVHEGMHFDVSRRAAERRLAALHAILDRMAREHAAEDVK